MTKVFFDTEFTGLHQRITLISIGLVSECGKRFYAEFTDYDRSQVDKWLEDNVISKLCFQEKGQLFTGNPAIFADSIAVLGNKKVIRKKLTEWLAQFDKVQMISDCLAYDWVLFVNIFGTAFDVPENVHYRPIDICSMFDDRGIDPDINREDFAFGGIGISENKHKHNALWDALVIQSCYDKLKDTPFI